jgi:hypothetical protein
MSARGRYVWFDLMTSDVEAAKAFYTETIGWKTQEWGGPTPYTMWNVKGDVGVGGVMELPAEVKQMGAPPHWMGYVAVDDVDATAKKAKELGGQVHKAGMDIPEVGRFAVLADPQGAAFAVFKSKQSDWKQADRQTPGAFSWHELNTTDYESAWKFYSALFGWEPTTSMDMGEGMGKYFMFKPAGDENSFGGMSNVAKTMKMPPHWLHYVTVENAADATKRITQKGGKLLNGPMDVPGGGKIAQFQDPQGAAFAIYAEK